MSLIRLQNVSQAFGPTTVLDAISLIIEPATRSALVGRNGEGKSTLLKIIAGLQQPDSGEVIRQSGVKIAYLAQSVPIDFSGSIYETVASGLGATGKILSNFYRESNRLAAGETEAPGDKNVPLIDHLANLQEQIDANDAWSQIQAIEQTLSRMQLDPQVDVQSLSGG